MARDSGKEPLEMIGGDVVELTKMLYAEREAHAAEVTRLRSALQIAGWRLERGYWSTRTFIDQKVPGWIRGDDSVSYPMLKGAGRVKTVLAAPPSDAVEAVEGMRKALEGSPCRCPVLLKCPHCGGDVVEVEGVDQFSGLWICGVCVRAVDLPKDPTRPCARCAALAAWKEATRG